ncbi:MAG: extracellular solute-binding protein [Clostridiales bacterium]|nr:extracellular solute-binding protein [Clostridiales bacterium]
MKLKKYLSLTLAFALLLTLCACGGGGASSDDSDQLTSSIGRYVETNITPESYAAYAADADVNTCTTLQYGDDGTLDLAVRFSSWADEGDMTTKTIWYHSEDKGDTWAEQELSGLWTGDFSDYWYFAADGTVYSWTFVMDYDEDNDTSTVEAVRLYRQKDGEETTTDYPFCDPDKNINGWSQCGLYQDKYLLFSMSGEVGSTLYAMDITTGEFLWSVSSDYYNFDFAVAGDTVFVSDGLEFHNSYNLSDGTSLEALDLTGMYDNGRLLTSCLMKEAGNYYFIDEDLNFCMGILGSNLKEIVLDGTDYRYSSDMALLGDSQDFYVAEDNTIYINARSEQKDLSLYRYDYDTGATYGDTTLTVWALEDSATVRQAIYAFQETHPEVEIDFQVQDYGEDDSKTLNDVLTTLNTQLLAGSGPDVLILDGADYETYASRGVLEDLSDLVEGTDFVGGTVSAFRQEDSGTYVIPARFTVPLLLSSQEETPDSLEELAEAVEQAGGDDPCLATTKYDMVWSLWDSSASALVNSDGVQTENLRTWLTALKTICDTYGYYAPKDDAVDSLSEEVIPGTYDYGNLNTYVEDDAYTWLNSDSPWGFTTLDAVEDLVMALSTYEKYEKEGSFSVAPLPGLVEGAYTPEVLLAVSAGSDDTETAKEFVACALSMEVQQYTYGDGLPVLQEAMDKQLDYFTDPAAEYGWDIEELRELLDGRTTPAAASELVTETVLELAEPYCSGELTLDEAVAQVEDELALMLAEQF